MKKTVFYIGVILLIMLSACTNGDESDSDEHVGEETKEQQEEVEIEEESDRAEKEEELEEIEDEDQREEDLVVKAKYKISENWSVEPIVEGTNENVVLLTIDDAPDKYALEMAQTLKQLDAGAIFFVNGHFLDTPEEKEILKQIHDMGFVIGNHTYSHAFLPDLTNEEQQKELVQLNDELEEIIGERPSFFRAPNGANTDFSMQAAEDEEMVVMNWTYGYDYFTPYMEADKLTTAMVTGEGPEVDVPYSLLKPGANLLMHDREWTNEALEDIVIGLREQGYEILDPHLIQTVK
ncbi:polysaccharide deacetylase family protein [Ornithinibacillus salinisoli]|uniref:Polysaccharide deacetylase family protein n=1 Tax=Ornithinibacillus salinisoli TaxID=1848459 RepID=A0ABW4VYZ7_9BACI